MARNRDNLQFIEINPDEVRSILARNRDNLQFIEINLDEVRSILARNARLLACVGAFDFLLFSER